MKILSPKAILVSFCFIGLLIFTGSSSDSIRHLSEEETELMNNREQDSLALIALYNATGGPNWNNPWDIHTTMNNWNGIMLKNGRVAEIRLHIENLNGNIPPEIGNLSHLRSLVLGGNSGLTGSIPPELSKLTNLTVLGLNSCRLSGNIPPELGNLRNLERILLNDNRNIEGNIPTEIKNWTKINSIEFDQNKLTGSIPPEFGNLKALDRLHLYENKLTGNIPPELGTLPNLSTLMLYGNNLSGCFSSSLSSLCDLSYNFNDNPDLPGNGDFASFCTLLDNPPQLIYPSEGADGIPINIPLIWNDPSNVADGYFISMGVRPGGSEILDSLDVGNTNTFAPSEFLPADSIIYVRLTPYQNPNQCAVSNAEEFHFSTTSTFTLPCRISDSLSLVAFHNSIGGLNWNLSQPIDNWEGISLIDGCVTEINLTAKNLTNSISPELGNLTHLTILDLSNNELSGAIPVKLSKCANLHTLNVRENSLDGNIPTEFGALKKLTVFDLGSNALSEAIPSTFGELDKLKYLDLSNNELSGNIPPELGLCTNLDTILLYNNFLSGDIPPELGDLSKVKDLEIDGNAFTGSIPPQLGDLKELKTLFIYRNGLSGNIPPELGKLTKLTRLDLSENQLSGSIPSSLGNLTSIQEIKLSDNLLSGCFPNSISIFCDLSNINYDFSNNPELPGAGDFESFCALINEIPQLITPSDGAEGVTVETSLIWEAPSVQAGGYLLHIGTSPGGSDILDGLEVNNITTFTPDKFLPFETTIYVRFVLIRDQCAIFNLKEFSFTTQVCPIPNLIGDCELKIPKAFTPAAQNSNSRFQIPFILDLPPGSYTRLRVFNRYKSLKYERENYQNDWDGADRQGRPLPTGTYFYLFEYEESGSRKQLRGTVTIVR